MRNILASTLALRKIELLSRDAASSKLALLACTPAGARELRALVGSFFPIDAHELQIYSQATLWTALASLRAKAVGAPPPGGLAGRLTGRAALHDALWSLPLSTFRPANAPDKYVPQLDSCFADLCLAGITPESYTEHARSLGGEDGEGAEVHGELAAAYAAWMAAGRAVGGRAAGLPQQVYDLRRSLAPEAPEGLASLQLWRSAARASLQHIVVADAERLSSPTIALLHGLFGPGGGGSVPGAARGSLTLLSDTSCPSPASDRVMAVLDAIVSASRVGAASPSVDWQLLRCASVEAACAEPIRSVVRRAGDSLAPPKTIRRRATTASAPEVAAISAPTVLPSALLQSARVQYTQSAVASIGESPGARAAFVECVGLRADADEVESVTQLARWLLDGQGGGPATVAVLCRSNAGVKEVGAALREALGARLAARPPSVRLYASARAALSRVPEVRTLLGLLGVLSRPDDPQHWYTLACSPVYGLPPYVVSKWVRAAAGDPSKRGVVFHIHAAIAASGAGELRDARAAAPPSYPVASLTPAAALPLPGSGGEVELWGLSAGSSASESEAEGESAVAQVVPEEVRQAPPPAPAPSPPPDSTAVAARRLLADLSAVYAVSASSPGGSACAALRAFLHRSGMEAALTEPRTGEEADAASAVTKLLEAATSLEDSDVGQSELLRAAKRAVRVGSDAGPLIGLPLVAEALLSAVYKGDMGLGLSFTTGGGGEGGGLPASEEEEGEVIDVLPLHPLLPSLRPAPAEVNASIALELSAGAGDAVCQQAFSQVCAALEDDGTLAAVDGYLDGTGAGSPLRLQGHVRPAALPTVFVTTLRRGVAHAYDYVLIPGATASAFPGAFADAALPLPVPLFAASSFLGPDAGPAGSLVLLPHPLDKAEHVDAGRSTFMAAIASARIGVLVSVAAPATARPSTYSTGRSKYVDEIFGPPPPPLPLSTPAPPVPAGGAGDALPDSRARGGAAHSAVPTMSDGAPPADRPDVQANGRLRLSYSAMGDFEWCPARYRWGRVESVGQPPSTVLLYGVALHAAVAAAGEAVGDAVLAVLGPAIRERLGGGSGSPFAVSTAALSLLLIPPDGHGLSPPALREARSAILAALPPVSLLHAHMRSLHEGAWMGRDDRFSKNSWDAGDVVASRLTPTALSERWAAIGSSLSASVGSSFTSVGSSFTSLGSSLSASDGSSFTSVGSSLSASGAAHYTHYAAETHGFSLQQLTALHEEAQPAIVRVAALEFERLKVLLSDEGADAARRGAAGPGRMALGIPALVERRFDLTLGGMSHAAESGSPVRITGVIDRVDMTLGLAGVVPGPEEGEPGEGAPAAPPVRRRKSVATAAPAVDPSLPQAMPLVREFKTSQQWKKVDGSALRTQLRSSLQSDLYAIALRDLAWKAGGGEGTPSATTAGWRVAPWAGERACVQLESVETGQVEGKVVGGREMAIARARIANTAAAIQGGDFTPTPSEHKCGYCPYTRLCDSSYGHGPALGAGRLQAARGSEAWVSLRS
jgi:hypothetical protein